MIVKSNHTIFPKKYFIQESKQVIIKVNPISPYLQKNQKNLNFLNNLLNQIFIPFMALSYLYS